MSRLSFDSPLGTQQVHGWCVDTMHAAAELGRRLAADGGPRSEWIDFAGSTVRLRARETDAGAGLARSLRHTLARGRVPFVREYENLSWLIERHFEAVLPLAAGVFVRQGTPTFEYLITRREPETVPWAESLGRAGAAERTRLLTELGRELGRMHSLGFLHGDLSPDALLVRPAASARRLVFRDTWAGGPRPHRGRYERDLARLLDAGQVDDEGSSVLLTHYYAQREAQDRGVRRGPSARRLARARHGPS